ncbi:SPOR domain-containing protein [Numidum massiliense]|uniref:SPOR domain-containing protein n=1 Tax=Numidum massiliense TaxID=1522315 RepID=UPI0006D5B568|nr:SPOR domain-containing protein [Numidum massiliense]
MSEPRVNVRSKNKRIFKSAGGGQERQHWLGGGDAPNAHELPEGVSKRRSDQDYWSHYVYRRKRKKPRRSEGKQPFTVKAKRAVSGGHIATKLVIAGLSAVLIGTLMGLFILNVFVTGDGQGETGTIDDRLRGATGGANGKGQPSQTGNGTSPQPEAGKQSSQSGEGDKQSTPGSGAGQGVPAAEDGSDAVYLPEVKAVWVQGGVFAKQSGAEEVAAAQRKHGFASAVVPMGDQYRVFLGVSFNRDDALKMAAEIKDSGTDVYLQDDIAIPLVPLTNIAQAQGQQLQQAAVAGQTVLDRVARLTAQGIAGEKVSGGIQREIKTIEQAHRTFLTALKNVEGELSRDGQEAVKVMAQGLSEVVAAMKQYAEEAKTSYLWQAQEGMINYLIAYWQLGQAK